MAHLAHLTEENGVLNDADIRAVRTLIAENATDASAPKVGTVEARSTVATKLEDLLIRRRAGVAQFPELAGPAEPVSEKSTGKFKQFARDGAYASLQSIKSYRPERRRIFRTSLILMLLLQPFLILGWSLAAGAAVMIYYLSVGGDAFWCKVLSVYSWMQKRWPETARAIKLRAFVLGRRWDRVLLDLPSGMADHLRPPDLRQMIAADAQHDAALNDRLNRLREEPAARY